MSDPEGKWLINETTVETVVLLGDKRVDGHLYYEIVL